MNVPEQPFEPFPKMPRLLREVVRRVYDTGRLIADLRTINKQNERLQQTIEHLEEQLRGFRSTTWFGAACMGNAIRIRCVADGWSKGLLIPNPTPPYSFRLPWCGGVKDFRCTHKVVEGHVLYEAR